MSAPLATRPPRPDGVEPVVSPCVVVLGIVLVGFGVATVVASDSLGLARPMGVAPLASSLVIALSVAVNRLGARRFHRVNVEGLAALVRGELDRAARTFEPGMRRWSLSARCTARHNLGLTRARQERCARRSISSRTT